MCYSNSVFTNCVWIFRKDQILLQQRKKSLVLLSFVFLHKAGLNTEDASLDFLAWDWSLNHMSWKQNQMYLSKAFGITWIGSWELKYRKKPLGYWYRTYFERAQPLSNVSCYLSLNVHVPKCKISICKLRLHLHNGCCSCSDLRRMLCGRRKTSVKV